MRLSGRVIALLAALAAVAIVLIALLPRVKVASTSPADTSATIGLGRETATLTRQHRPWSFEVDFRHFPLVYRRESFSNFAKRAPARAIRSSAMVRAAFLYTLVTVKGPLPALIGVLYTDAFAISKLSSIHYCGSEISTSSSSASSRLSAALPIAVMPVPVPAA